MSLPTIILGVAVCVIMSAANAQHDFRTDSAMRYHGTDNSRFNTYQEDDLSDLGESRTNVGGAVLLAIKNQFKGIIHELCLQAFEYLKTILHHLKIKVLSKLGSYTLKDLFGIMFDGVAEFVVDSPPDVDYDAAYVEDHGSPISHINPNYFDGYGLASLLRAKKTVS